MQLQIKSILHKSAAPGSKIHAEALPMTHIICNMPIVKLHKPHFICDMPIVKVLKAYISRDIPSVMLHKAHISCDMPIVKQTCD